MVGLLIKLFHAGSGAAAAFINRVAHLVSVTSYRMYYRFYILNRRWFVNNYCYVHHANLKKEMFSIGGIHLLVVGFVPPVLMIFYGCLTLRLNTFLQQEIKMFWMNVYLFSTAAC